MRDVTSCVWVFKEMSKTESTRTFWSIIKSSNFLLHVMMMEEAIQYHYAETSSRIQDNSIWCLTVISEDQCLSIMMRRCFCSWRREEKRRRGEEEASEF